MGQGAGQKNNQCRVSPRAIAYGRWTDSRVATAIGRLGRLAFATAGSSFVQYFHLFCCTRPALSPAAGNPAAAWICRSRIHPPRPSFPSTVPLSGPSMLASRSTHSHQRAARSLLGPYPVQPILINQSFYLSPIFIRHDLPDRPSPSFLPDLPADHRF
jgi:hypothetical protein